MARSFASGASAGVTAAEKAAAEFQVVGDDEAVEPNDRERLQKLLADIERRRRRAAVAGVHRPRHVRRAHGEVQSARAGRRRPRNWPRGSRRQAAARRRQCASASAPFINRLAGENRVVITATKSGDEQNFARFGQYISAAIADPAADLDKDGQVSLLEAYLTACRQVEEFYEQEARLATEHALLDDNGDGLGTPAAWFRGLRATQRAKDGAALDGTRAHQFHLVASDRERKLPPEVRKRRDELELKIAALRDEKQKLDEEEYYERLEKLMVELAQVYDGSKARPMRHRIPTNRNVDFYNA